MVKRMGPDKSRVRLKSVTEGTERSVVLLERTVENLVKLMTAIREFSAAP